MNITDKLLKNIFSSWFYWIFQFSIGFFLMPFLIHHLGKELYGTWIIVMTLTGYIGFFDFGLRGAIVKYIPEFETRNDLESINKIINTSWLLYIVFGITAIVSAFICALFLDKIFRINPENIFVFKLSFLIMALNLGSILFSLIFSGILEGFKRQEIISGIEAAGFCIQAIFIVVFILKGHGIVSLAVITFSITVLKQAVKIIFIRKFYPHLKFDLSLSEKKYRKMIFGYSLFSFSIAMTRNVISSLPNMILGSFLGPSYVTFYSVSTRLTDYSKVFLSGAADMLIPFVSSFNAVNDKLRIQKSFLTGSRYTYAIIFFINITFIMLGRQFLKLWVGEDFIRNGYSVLCIITSSLFFTPSPFIINAILSGMGKLKTYALLNTLELITSSVLAMILLKEYKLVGVAIGFAIPYVINFGIIQPFLIMKHLGISFQDYIKSIFFPCFIPGLILLAFYLLFNSNCQNTSYFLLTLEFFGAAVIYLCLCTFLVATKLERGYYFSKIINVIKNDISNYA